MYRLPLDGTPCFLLLLDWSDGTPCFLLLLDWSENGNYCYTCRMKTNRHGGKQIKLREKDYFSIQTTLVFFLLNLFNLIFLIYKMQECFFFSHKILRNELAYLGYFIIRFTFILPKTHILVFSGNG